MNTGDDEIPKHRSKKNTKKWCKGKEGREHKPIWRVNEKYSWAKSEWLIYSCTECGKEIEHYHEAKWHTWGEAYERPTVGSTEPLKKKVKSD